MSKFFTALKTAALVFLIEVARISPALVLGGAFLLINRETPSFSLIFMILSGTAIVLAFAHLTRKILFPYLDLKLFFKSAQGSAGSSAAIVLGILAFLAFLVWLTISTALGGR